jgi:hypothetical protein
VVHELEHEVYAVEFRLHSKLPPSSVEVKLNVGIGLLLGSGGFCPMAVSGGAVSTTQV